MANITQQFVNKLYKMQNTQFPVSALNKAQECFLDYISVVLGGCKIYSYTNKKYIETNKLNGKCHIIGMEDLTDLHTAVLINAFNAHILELDDSHRVAMTHLGAPIFSALIGVAEIYSCTLRQVIESAIVGYEAAIRLANAIQPSHKKRGFHVSGTCCTVGCAMAVAALLKYSEAEMSNVFSAAATTSAGLLAVISGASEQKPYNIANAAVAGVNAALYGKWFNGATDILGDSRGFFHALADVVQEEKLFEEGYAIETIYQKLYAACRHCHAPMEAMMQLKCEANNIEHINVFVYDLAIKGHDHFDIEGISSAKQSIPYGVSVACINHNCGLSAFTREMVNNQDVLSLAKRISVLEDPKLTKMLPNKRAARVAVVLKDGTQLEKQVDYPKGEPENPITPEEMKTKFYEMTSSIGISNKNAQIILNEISSHLNASVNCFLNFLKESINEGEKSYE